MHYLPSFRKILIANRGEIAVRLIRACQEMGIRIVAVYPEADAGALHTALVDESVLLGPPPPLESYLRADLSMTAPNAGVIRSVSASAGEIVDLGQSLVEIA